jgi:hypothetical protein
VFIVLQVVTVLLVALAAALPLAHALELPGKMRLDEGAYVAVQPIYYPGFTVAAGIGEAGGMIATAVLLIFTPSSSQAFPWTIAALVALVAMHLAYWVVTHPVNKFWLAKQDLKGLGGGFFRFDPLNRSAPAASGEDPWKRMRNRWEYSHVLRAALATTALLCLVMAVALRTPSCPASNP